MSTPAVASSFRRQPLALWATEYPQNLHFGNPSISHLLKAMLREFNLAETKDFRINIYYRSASGCEEILIVGLAMAVAGLGHIRPAWSCIGYSRKLQPILTASSTIFKPRRSKRVSLTPESGQSGTKTDKPPCLPGMRFDPRITAFFEHLRCLPDASDSALRKRRSTN